MDNIVMDEGNPSQHTRFELGMGSQVAAQAPLFPSNQVATVKSGPGPEIWETHRSTIKRLYLDEDKTLNEVMAIMQNDYGHKATMKMYKSRITKWGLDKHCKAREMKAIARKKVERDGVGKASSFRIRGRQVEIEEVLRYAKRKRYQSIEELVARDKSPEANTPSDIDYSTPSALTPPLSGNNAYLGNSAQMTDAEAEIILCQTHSPQTPRSSRRKTRPPVSSSDAAKRQLLCTNDGLCRLSSLGGVPRSLKPPRDLFVPEEVFSAIKAFSQWSFSEWSTDENGYLVSRNPETCSVSGKWAIWDFHDSCTTATFLLKQRLFVEARQLLVKACERSIDIIKEGHPRTITIVLDIYFRLQYAGFGDFAIQIFGHLRSTAMMPLLNQRIFHHLFDNLLLLDKFIEEFCSTAWQCIEDILEQHMGPFNWLWLSSHLHHIATQTVSSENPWHEAERLVRSLSTKCEQICGKSDPRNWVIQYYLASNVYNQGKLKEAEEIGLHIIQCAESLKSEHISRHCTMLALEIVSKAQQHQGKGNLAESNLRYCIDIAREEYGEEGPITIRYSQELEAMLSGWGRQEEAMALAAQRTRILGPPEIMELIE